MLNSANNTHTHIHISRPEGTRIYEISDDFHLSGKLSLYTCRVDDCVYPRSRAQSSIRGTYTARVPVLSRAVRRVWWIQNDRAQSPKAAKSLWRPVWENVVLVPAARVWSRRRKVRCRATFLLHSRVNYFRWKILDSILYFQFVKLCAVPDADIYEVFLSSLSLSLCSDVNRGYEWCTRKNNRYRNSRHVLQYPPPAV